MKRGWKHQQSPFSLFENPFDKFGMTYESLIIQSSTIVDERWPFIYSHMRIVKRANELMCI